MVSERSLSRRQQICLLALGLPVYSRRIDLPGAAPVAAWRAPVLLRRAPAIPSPASVPVVAPVVAPVVTNVAVAAPDTDVAARFSLRLVAAAGDWLLLLHLPPQRDLVEAEHQLLRNILQSLGDAEAELGPLFSFPPPGNRLWQSDRRAAEDAMAGLLLRHSVDACKLLVLGEELLTWLPASWQERAHVAPDLSALLGNAAAKRRLWREMQACCS